MGWFDGDSVVSSSRSKRHRSHSHSHSKHRRSRSRSSSRSRSRSRTRKTASVVSFLAGAPPGTADHYRKHNRSSSSFFGLGNGSSRSLFGFGRSSSSKYRRSSRPNFMHRAWKKLKRILRDLAHYAKRHPLKVFMLVIMPLITTGALAGLLAKFGLRLPRSIERMMGLAAKAGSGDSIGLVSEAVRMAGDMGSQGGKATKYERRSSSRRGGGGGGYSKRTNVEADWGSGGGGGGGGGSWGMSDGLKYVGKMFG
ncbi:hypothetical protein MKZ38_002977 [Zalerion maritima]|uniref:Uncharacterized protein n=1 Tax=Zalerion maritima TaxID=339359 RepID=A0AAD5RUT5_9PEZI|nr:hypothetical protein MKZ38_002977 [Zalerion maritima]